MSTTIYAVAVHRSWDNYYAKFEGFATLAEVQVAFPGIAELTHGFTMTFRRDTRCVSHQNDGLRRPKADDGRTPDEFVVLRYDVPAEAEVLHVQFIRWKYGTLTMTASHVAPPALPSDLDLLSDCVYEAVWVRPVNE